MKKFLFITTVMALLFTLCTNVTAPAQAEQGAFAPLSAGSDAPTPTTHKNFLPVINNGSPSSVQLIDKAIKDGSISAETGLIYKVFASFSDSRLPGQYIGSGIGRAGDGIIAEVVAQAQAHTLSPSALQTLTPFFVPPDHAGSWYPQTMSSVQGDLPSAPESWVGIKTANNKVWIMYNSTDAAAAAKAPGLKAAFDAKIWSNLTNLMGRSPMDDGTHYMRIYLWNSYIDSTGITVPFDANTLGVTVGTRCDQSATVIYLPSRLALGDETHAGMIQYATHEFMHAIQFSYTIQNCGKYTWLKEATATWAEDFVYPNANSEWDLAPMYMDHPDWMLDSNAGLHDYGSYLLPYYLTHQLGDNTIIRKMWEGAAAEPNSYLAVKNSLPSSLWKDNYWSLFLQALWNKAPFQEFYKTNDQLLSTVKAESSQVISAASGEQIIPLPGDFVTGGAKFYRFTVDANVRSLTILNGLGKKLSKGAAELDDTIAGDQMYLSDDLSAADAAGVTVIALMKVAGSNWQAVPLGGTGGQLENTSHCMDVQGKIEELVIIQSNGDFDHPNTRTISPKGLPTTLFANNLPCWKVSGSASMTVYNAGVTKTFSTSNAVYSYPSAMLDFSKYPYLNNIMAYPEIQLFLLSADVNWTVSGTDSAGSAYSGSGSFHVSEQPGAGTESIRIYNGVLKGSPTYRGYAGQGIPEDGTEITYSVTGKDCPGSSTEGAYSFLEIPLADNRAAIKISAGGGSFSGSYKRDEPGDDYELMTWNLIPQTK